jgi:hypothetical protein
MTEAEWLAASDPETMLASLRGQTCATDRKLRLFACACARLMGFPADSRAWWTAIESFERFADGGEPEGHLAAAGEATGERLLEIVENAARVTTRAVTATGGTATGTATRQRLAGLLRCIIRRCTTRAVDPDWLAWNGGTVRRLAESAYSERSLPEGTLDPARLALVADGLEDAGCTDGELLRHLRGPGRHVRGCWALDFVLSKP